MKSSRQRYIDWARGLAVLVMVEAHTLDAWTRAADRSTLAFRRFTILGGLAAPLFLWLAGTASVLAAEAASRRTGSRRAAAIAICRRGLEIFILAFLFRLQSFVLSPGNSLLSLFKVDILNVMGPSIVGAGIVWGVVRGRAAAAITFAAIATVITMITPMLRVAEWVAFLPTWIQWYVRPAAEHTTFTMFPWCGFVFAGAACGVLMANVNNLGRVQVALCVSGALLLALGFYTASLPSIYRLSSFWNSSPTYFAIRVGVMLVLLTSLYALQRLIPALGTVLQPLERFGRASLFVYWIHVELVYGYATWPLHGRLPLWATEGANVVFSALMFGAIILRDRLLEKWRGRGPVQSPSPAPT